MPPGFAKNNRPLLWNRLKLLIMLRCDNLACTRDAVVLFRGVGFTLTKGSLLVIRGRNGCGKTTILQALAGFYRPSAGDITFKGKPLNVRENLREFWQNVHFIQHYHGLHPEYTVVEQLRFWGRLYDTSMLLGATISFMNFSPLLDVPVAFLSAGWRQRLSLARLVLSPRKVWLLDEPEAHLDDEGRERLHKLIATRCEQGGIVILSSHQKMHIGSGQELLLDTYRG